MARAPRHRGDSDEEDNGSELDLSDLVDQSPWTKDAATSVAAGQQESHRLQKQSIGLQEESNFLNAAQLQVAVASNELLGQIDSSLDQIGFGIGQMHEDLSRQEAIQRQQLQKQDEHLRQQATHIDLTRQQLELQMQQTEKIERDRLVKDLLYNLERYNKKLMKLSDPVARAYGARRLLERLSISKFGSKDLFEIADKRHFDEQTAAVNACIEGLDAQGREALAQFEKAYTDYLRASRVEQTENVPQPGERQSFSEIAIKQARPRPPEHNGRPLDAATADTLTALAKSCGKKRQVSRTIMFAGGATAGVFALITLALMMTALKSGGVALPLAITAGVVTVVAGLLAGCPPVRNKAASILGEEGADAEADEFKLTDRHGLTFEEADTLLTAWQQYSFAARQFDREFPSRLEDERTRVEAHNRAVDDMNTQRATILAQRTAKRDGALKGLRRYINAFLDKHPGIQDWVPKLVT